MQPTQRYESTERTQKRTVQYTSVPEIIFTPKRQLTRKEEATKDLFVILHTIQKRKEFRAFEQFKFYSERFITKQLSAQYQQYRHRRSSRDKKSSRPKSVGLYAEYSRARLLKDIVGKLKAKHEIADTMDQDEIAAQMRVVRLEKMLNETYENNASFSRDLKQTGQIKMADLMKQAVERKRQNSQERPSSQHKFVPIQDLHNRSNYLNTSQQKRMSSNSRQKQILRKQETGHYDHFHKYSAMNQQWHQNSQVQNNQGNYQRVRHFVSPPMYPMHAHTAPVIPPRPPNPQKLSSQTPYRQTVVKNTNFQTESAYKNQKQAAYQTSYSPRSSKGISVISQLPFKKRTEQASEQSKLLKTESIKPNSYKPQSFPQGDIGPVPGAQYCHICGRYCRCPHQSQ